MTELEFEGLKNRLRKEVHKTMLADVVKALAALCEEQSNSYKSRALINTAEDWKNDARCLLQFRSANRFS